MRPALGALLSGSCAAALLLFSACGSDETGTAPDDAAPEATPEVDAQAADTSAPDVGTDVVERDTAPFQTYCGVLSDTPHPPRFCDDFDDHDATNGWQASTISPATSTLDVDVVQFVSAPCSLITATNALGDTDSANVSVRTTLIDTVVHPNLQFEARFSQTVFDTTGYVAIATLNVSLSHFFILYLFDPMATPPGPALVETNGDDVTHHVLLASPTPNTWQNVTIDVDFDAGLANVSFGATAALTNEPVAKVVGTEATIRVGAVYMGGPLPAFTGNFDNVVLDF